VESFAVRQARLLASLWSVLAPGGRLLYSTCSILAQENQRIGKEFIAQTDDVELLPINLAGAIQLEPGVQLLPVAGRHDGFYYLHLRKRPGDRLA
jgi:16S rRNA (cytosine967-C5)-methyltransferase